MVTKIKSVAKKINAVALMGFLLIGGMGMMSFVGEKAEVRAAQSTDVIRGVLDPTGGTPGRIYLTAADVGEGQGECALGEMLCKISVEPTLIKYDAFENRYYIDETDPHTPEEGNGPYLEN